MSSHEFPTCPVCRADAWSVIYRGPVRDGAFGRTRDASIARCGGCGIDRLAESACLGEQAYRDESYRHHIGQDHDLARHYATHDPLARFTLDTLWPTSLRGQIVADVGCGGGSLLDHIRGLSAEIVAIDPDRGFASSLRARGYCWYPSAGEAAKDFSSKIDVALSIQVIEHVVDPNTFLAEIRGLLKPNGLLLLSTPNRADILMEILPKDFPAFFYRTQHRWCFDAASLTRCAETAGFRVNEVRHVHRYGIANALLWLRERKPSSHSSLPPLDRQADDMWRQWLESNGRADNLYMTLKSA